MTTGTSAVSLNPAHVTEVRWWERADFEKREVLLAAELIAFEVLDPVLRSRGKITATAKALAKSAAFAMEARTLFEGAPTGHVLLPSLQDALGDLASVLERIEQLEKRLVALEERTTQSH